MKIKRINGNGIEKNVSRFQLGNIANNRNGKKDITSIMSNVVRK